jgi:hypothetical protein
MNNYLPGSDGGLLCATRGRYGAAGGGDRRQLIRQLKTQLVQDLGDNGVALLLVILVSHGVI